MIIDMTNHKTRLNSRISGDSILLQSGKKKFFFFKSLHSCINLYLFNIYAKLLWTKGRHQNFISNQLQNVVSVQSQNMSLLWTIGKHQNFTSYPISVHSQNLLNVGEVNFVKRSSF
jgi:hypothetical protein